MHTSLRVVFFNNTGQTSFDHDCEEMASKLAARGFVLYVIMQSVLNRAYTDPGSLCSTTKCCSRNTRYLTKTCESGTCLLGSQLLLRGGSLRRDRVINFQTLEVVLDSEQAFTGKFPRTIRRALSRL